MNTKDQQSGVTVSLKKSFLRYNVSAITATAVDKCIALLLHYVFLLDGLIATPIGMIFGSMISFLLGRNWTFISKDNTISNQGMRFFLTAAGNFAINWSLVWLFHTYLGIEYAITVFLAATIAGLCYSFPMQRYFVYK